jgi:hypothetical protein
MPRYFFHVQDGQDLPDEGGTSFTGVEGARAAAVIAAGEALKELGARFWRHAHWRMHVTDEQGATVCDLRFSNRLGILPPYAPHRPPARNHESAPPPSGGSAAPPPWTLSARPATADAPGCGPRQAL